MKTEQELKESLLRFVQTSATVIGTDETCAMLDSMTEFIQTNPETVVELKQFVESEPKMIAELMTKKGITEAKKVLSMVKNMNIFA
ncbi:hypothetical protein [Dyadobacter psychrotolerans]|uniref:Uncharacterized protein n=1 Tax=Dyadobacter psychrotolerans TaxID=2541721 RepID=A0A4R5DLZ9_9BACT|nr:hypothetical protein [Dyadobacter psychrotolerans]TDE15292.1 hypothetical protein E0F88_12270 [Dyadobacter psychrotolerans]